MPFVHIEILEGRTLEQKRKLAAKVTDVLVETTGCPIEEVKVIIQEMSRENLAGGGVLYADK